MQVEKYSFDRIPYISKRDLAYINQIDLLQDFYKWKPDISAFEEIIKEKKSQSQDRQLLVEVLQDQYSERNETEIQQKSIALLRHENTFTIVTAHQPTLLFGPLYYIFKILSAINVCQNLKEKHPSFNFIPMFISGGEDHDFEEMNHLRLFKQKFEWNNEEFIGGSVGKLSTQGLKEIIESVSEKLGIQNIGAKWLKEVSIPLAESANNYGQFALDLTHSVFRKMGLLVLNMDDHRLKSQFANIMKNELLNASSYKLVSKTQSKLSEKSWKAQTHVREINLFYRTKNQRLRIELKDGIYHIVDSEIVFTQEEILKELADYPDRFSPNVILRPLFQELVLPNLAYVGGGGEIAYWLERKAQFEYYNIPFPMLLRRCSAAIIPHHLLNKIEKLDIDIPVLFQEQNSLINAYLQEYSPHDLSIIEEEKALSNIFDQLSERAADIDPSLRQAVLAEGAKANKILSNVASRIKKAAKKQEETNINRIENIHQSIFPDQSLMERKDNILEYINVYGWNMLSEMLPHMDPFEKQFIFFKMSKTDLPD